MKVSQKGLYALEAMISLAHHYRRGVVKIHDIASEEHLPEKFLEIILIELKNARLVESTRGAKGGYQLRRPPSDIKLSEILRIIDGPVAPFADAEHLRSLMEQDAAHCALYKVFLEVRDAIAEILDKTTVSDIAGLTALPDSGKPERRPRSGSRSAGSREERASHVRHAPAVVSTVAKGSG